MVQTIRDTDKVLQTNVTDELLYNPRIQAPALMVSAIDGVVTLSGNVGSLPERYAVKHAAMRVWGVKSVTDDMVVRAAGMSGTSDAEIAQAANQMLRWTVDVPFDTVKADVRNHAITLSGTCAWHYQRKAAVRAVMYLKSVTGVTNAISLIPTAPAPGMKATIEAAVLRNAQLDSGNIAVEVSGGEVALRGNVRTWADRRQAEHVAWAASGVTSVKNELAIAS
jgi:osmotically-inducible protein OsmY